MPGVIGGDIESIADGDKSVAVGQVVGKNDSGRKTLNQED